MQIPLISPKMKRQGKEWPKNVYARAKEFYVTESTSKNDVIQRVWKKKMGGKKIEILRNFHRKQSRG